MTGLGLWSWAAPVTASTPIPTSPPASTLPAKPAAPVAGISFVKVTISGSKPSLAKLIEISAGAFGDDRTWRHAGGRHVEAGNRGFGAGRRGCDADVFRGAARKPPLRPWQSSH